jgi:hypothetical protein
MTGSLLEIITSADPARRNQSLDAWCQQAAAEELLAQCAELDAFRRRSENLYERVRALFFLYAIYRFHLPGRLPTESRDPAASLIPFAGYEHLLRRRFEEAIDHFLAVQRSEGPSDGIASALAVAYQSARVPDPRRPSPPHRPLHPRQRLDVPARPSPRPAAPDPA